MTNAENATWMARKLDFAIPPLKFASAKRDFSGNSVKVSSLLVSLLLEQIFFCNFRISFNSNFLQDAHVISKELGPATKPQEPAPARVDGPETDANLRNLRVSYK